MQVAVIGPGVATDAQRATARAVGAGLAQAGVILVTGGLGGVMAAATAGAREAGGTTLALLPGDRAADAVVRPTIAVPTGLGEGRNALVVRAADVVVAIGGSWGTLSELALALRAGTPVVGINTWTLTEDLQRLGLDDAVVRVPDATVGVRAVLGILDHSGAGS